MEIDFACFADSFKNGIIYIPNTLGLVLIPLALGLIQKSKVCKSDYCRFCNILPRSAGCSCTSYLQYDFSSVLRKLAEVLPLENFNSGHQHFVDWSFCAYPCRNLRNGRSNAKLPAFYR